MADLFTPAAKTPRHLKVLLHGGPGVGKTLAALSFPGPVAVLDLEGGTALYGDRGFDVLRTKDLRKIEEGIARLGGGKYRTVVVDPLTVLWQLLQDAGQGIVDRRKGDSLESGQALTTREWGLIKRRYASILTRLNNLPCHVVLIARDTDLYEGSGDQLKRVGIKADVEKSTPYVADLVLRLEAPDGKHSAVVEKSRAAGLAVGQRLTGYTSAPGQGLYDRHLATLAGAQAAKDPPPQFEEDAAVVANNAAALEPPAIAPEIKAAMKRYADAAKEAGHTTPPQQRAWAEAHSNGRVLETLTVADWDTLAGTVLREIADGPIRTWTATTPAMDAALPPAADAEEGEEI